MRVFWTLAAISSVAGCFVACVGSDPTAPIVVTAEPDGSATQSPGVEAGIGVGGNTNDAGPTATVDSGRLPFVFTSTYRFAGDLKSAAGTGAASADAECAKEGQRFHAARVVAWLATKQASAIERLGFISGQNYSWATPDAPTVEALSYQSGLVQKGGPTHSLAIDAAGQPVVDLPDIWTGAKDDGTLADQACKNENGDEWTVSDDNTTGISGWLGADLRTTIWSHSGTSYCQLFQPVICLELPAP